MEQTLGKRIMTNRKRLGLTQDQLAEKLGVTAQAVSKWENDLSCPDISTLPVLAEIFGTSIDTLLGRTTESYVHEGQIVDEDNDDSRGIHINNGAFEFKWDNDKKDTIAFGAFVVLVGILYLIVKVLALDVSLWDILWPSALLTIGVRGLSRKVSAFCLGCVLAGAYFLIDKLFSLQLATDSSIIFAVAILLFGLGLLADAFQKPKGSHHIHIDHDTGSENFTSNESQDSLNIGDDCFTYNGSFGEGRQHIVLPCLRTAEIRTSFGEYTIDLTNVATVTNDCQIQAHCSFGEQIILVPDRFEVRPISTTSFAGFNIEGAPQPSSAGFISIDAHVSFGSIVIKYV